MAKNSELEQIGALFRALDDSVGESSDQEVSDDLKALGVDPLRADEQMKFAIEGAIDHFYADGLRNSRERRIEGGSTGYRELLLETLRDNSSAQCALGPRFVSISNVHTWSDAEILGAIRCLLVLGFIDMNRVNYD